MHSATLAPAVAATPLAPAAPSIPAGLAFGLGAALIWSVWSVATRFAVTTSLGPYDVTFLRFAVSAFLLWPVLLFKGTPWRAAGAKRLAIMFCGAGVPFVLLSSFGMHYAPASHTATLMVSGMPIWVALLSALLHGERFARKQIAGMAAVVLGVLCIGGYAVFMERAAGVWRGDLLLIAAGFFFACFTVTQRVSGLSPWRATVLVNVVSALAFSPVYFLWLSPRIFSAPLTDVLIQALVQGVGVAFLGMLFYAQAVRHLGAPRAAIFGALTPAFAVLLSLPVLHEVPGALTLAGIALVMGGVGMVVLGRR